MDSKTERDAVLIEPTVPASEEPGDREMPCPVCGAPMPDLKGGKATICAVCGFKDSCCY